ncbi:MAG: acetate--CoA ligase family protein [Spirochaetia bacterium]|jgi:acetyltransferase|nr:acetate--CoA ligase family protein [Spirochaetia bacterium]
MSRGEIKRLFEPESVAVIGASTTPGKIGYSVVRNLRNGGYEGKVYPINPKADEIWGYKVYAGIGKVEGPVDLTVITVPAALTYDSVKEAVAKGTKYITIITSGFGEVGDYETENKIVACANEGGARILGPNIFGVFSAAGKCNTTFSANNILPGNVAILTQSGALGIAMIGKTAAANIGLSVMASIGNKSDLDEADCLEYVIRDDSTKAILMYVEGIKDGIRFMDALRRATAVKPVIILKAGRSQRGAMAAASHTGSLAGSDEIFDAVIKQCGAARAETLEEAFNWCNFAANTPPPKKHNFVIITNGGGIGVMATDACETYNIPLYDDQNVLKEAFTPMTPAFGSVKNPIDITGGATSTDYNLALAASAATKEVEGVMALYCETATFDTENLTPMVKETYKKHKELGKAIVYALVGGELVSDSIRALQKDGIPAYSDVMHAVSSLGVSYNYQNYIAKKHDAADWAKIDTAGINSIIDRALADGRSFLLANEGSDVMKAAGVAIPGSEVAPSLEKAIELAEKMGYPVVMKVVSRDILHKSDAGGVILGVKHKDDVIAGYDTIIKNCKKHNPKAVIDGIEVTEMVSAGTEFIVGGRRDPAFGPVVMFGLGGVYVEVMKDVVFRALPISRDEARSMVDSIKAAKLLSGVRGQAKRDVNSIVDTIIKVSTILNECPRITDIEVNPIVVYEEGKGLKAVDSRIMIAK